MDRPSGSSAHPDAVRGDLGHYPVPRILFHLLRSVFTGVLVIDDRSGRKTQVFFREGLPCFADLASAEDVLGRVLLERGLINQDQYNRSLQELSLGGKLQGQILIAMGALTEAQLVEGLKLQLHRKVNRLFYCVPTTTFAIVTENHEYGLQAEAAQVRIDPLYVIYQGVRNAFRAPQLAAELEKLSGSLLRLHEQFPQVAPRFGFAREERPLLDVLQADQIPYERIYRITNLSPIETQMLIYTLWVTEMLTLEQNPMALAGQTAQPIAPTPSQTAQPIAPTPSQTAQPIAPTPSQTAQPIAPTPSQTAQPIAPTPSQTAQPIAPTPSQAMIMGAPPNYEQERFDDEDIIEDDDMLDGGVNQYYPEKETFNEDAKEDALLGPSAKAQAQSPAPSSIISKEEGGTMDGLLSIAALVEEFSGDGARTQEAPTGGHSQNTRETSIDEAVLGDEDGPLTIDLGDDLDDLGTTGPQHKLDPPAPASPLIPAAPAPTGAVIAPPPPDETSAPFIPAPPEPTGAVITPAPPHETSAPFIPAPPAPTGAIIAPAPPHETSAPFIPAPPAPTDAAAGRAPSPLAAIVLGDAEASPSSSPALAPNTFTPPASQASTTAPSARKHSPETSQTKSPAKRKEAEEHRALILTTLEETKDADHFQVLGVDRDDNVNTVRTAYFALAKKFHPDKISGLGLQDLSDEAEEVFRRINAAHTTLSDPEARDEYIEKIDRGTTDAEERSKVREALEAEFSFQKGTVFFRKRNHREALAEFKKAFRLAPDEGEHLAWVAWTVFSDPHTDSKKFLPKLKQQLLEAIKITPSSAMSHYFLGEIYLALEEEKRATTCFHKAIELKPNHIEAERQLRILEMRRAHAGKAEKKSLFDRFKKKK